MKVILTFTLVLLLQTLSFGQNGFTNIEEAKNVMTNGLKQGKWVEYLKFNIAWAKVNDGYRECNKDTADYYRLAIYKDNQITGSEHINYASGVLMSDIAYSNGLKNGVAKSYYKTGVLMLETNYVNGLQKGLMKLYTENGKLLSEMQMIDDHANGPYKTYHETGVVSSEMFLLNGEINGPAKYFNQNGKLISEMFFLNNKGTGEVKMYNENGDLISIQFKDSLGNTVVRQFNVKNGNIQSEFSKEKGMDVMKIYYEGGQLLMISYQKDGKVVKQKTFKEKRGLMSETDKLAFDAKRREQRMEFWSDVSEVITTGIQLYYDYSGTTEYIGTYTLPTTIEEATDQILNTIQELIPND